MKNQKLHKLTLLAVLGAWALVFRYLNFPILPAAPFLKIDFSDLIAFIGMLIYGPHGLVVVAAIRDLGDYLVKGGEVGIPIGMIMSFTATIVMFLPSHWILKAKEKINWRHHLVMSTTLILALTVSMALLNYYLALPLYIKVMNFPIEDIGGYVLSIILPFNFIKGVMLACGQWLVLKSLQPLIAKKQAYYLTSHKVL